MSKSEERRINIQQTSLDKPRKGRPTKLETLLKEASLRAKEWDRIKPLFNKVERLSKINGSQKSVIRALTITVIVLTTALIYLLTVGV